MSENISFRILRVFNPISIANNAVHLDLFNLDSNMARSRKANSRSGLSTFFKSSKSSGITKTKKSICPPTSTKNPATISGKATKTFEPITFPNLYKEGSASDKVDAKDSSLPFSISPSANIAVASATQAPAQNTSLEPTKTSLPDTDNSQTPIISIDASGNAIINRPLPISEMTNAEILELTLELYKHFDYAYHEIRGKIEPPSAAFRLYRAV
ncbi:hypothetical protein BDZ45DRAFT_246596 [Acephala macrosclerotiorum]|nr:hypothetical protein BDZ45DRAFT_246596 [Acephala macrosclerotiorum]